MLWRKKERHPHPLTDAYIMAEISARDTHNDFDQQRLNAVIGRMYNVPELRHNWKAHWKSKNADENTANAALNKAFMTLIEKVRQHNYIEDNWQGFIFHVARLRLLDSFKQQTQRAKHETGMDELAPLEQAGDHSLESSYLDKNYLETLLTEARLNDHQKKAIDLQSQGYTYEKMSKLLNRSETNLRKDVSSGLFCLREHLISVEFKKGSLSFCQKACQILIEGKLTGHSLQQITALHPVELSAENFPQPSASNLENQYKHCINCLVRQCR